MQAEGTCKMSVKLLSNFLQFHFLISLLSLVGSQTIDAHGGIPMGKVAHCDDAEVSYFCFMLVYVCPHNVTFIILTEIILHIIIII